MATTTTRSFLALLGRRRGAHQAVRYAAALLRWSAWSTAAFLGLLVADYFLSFEPGALAWLGRGACSAAIAALLVLLIRAGGRTRRQLAADLDRRGGDLRQPMLSAYELAAAAPPGEVEDFLTDLAVSRAAVQLRGLPVSAALPMPLLKRRILAFLSTAAVVAAVLLPAWPIACIPLARFLHPDADIPPYSLYTFTLQPEKPAVMYGDDANLAVEIGGPQTPPGVALLTRVNGAVQRTPCFAEGSHRYAQRVERVTRPVEFCFAVGRARSRWHHVDVNLEPRIAVARFTLQPPEYSRQPLRTFIAGAAPLRALRGSRVRLDITSNRPLKGGTLTFRPADSGSAPRTVAGRRAGLHLARFEWELTNAAALDVTVRDVQDMTNRVPYRLTQQVQPDLRPVAAITDPPRYALATPGVVLKLTGYAEDDLGVRRLDLVRGLGGYHDRVLNLGPDQIKPREEFVHVINMARLGVTPGQTLEFFLEVTDTNPDESGRTASDVTRVEIISEEDYAQMLRERLDAEQFLARYRAAAAALRAVQDALKKTEEALGRPGSEDERSARRAELEQALQQAQEMFRRLADDLPIYAMEQESQAVFKATAQALQDALDSLRQAGADRASIAKAVAEMKQRIGAREEATQRVAEQASYVGEVARVLELENLYVALVAEQAALARRYRRYGDASRIRDAEFFRTIEQRQKQIRDALELYRNELRERAQALPEDPELAALRQSALDFAGAIDKIRIPAEMSAAEAAAGKSDGSLSKEKVEQALVLLRSLLQKDGEGGEGAGFVQACKNPKFCPREPQQTTLRQLGQCKRPGIGVRMGLGWGAGAGSGEGDDGYSAGASTPLNIPMIGPPRTAFGGASGEGDNGTSAPSGERATIGRETAVEALAGEAGSTGSTGALRLDEAPEKYREALKAYFGTSEARP